MKEIPLHASFGMFMIGILATAIGQAEERPGAPGGKPKEVTGTASAADALTELKAGNARFTMGAMIHSHQDAARRASLATGQTPIAVILGCADSRVAPEVIFDQGLGDLFVIRVAGNVIDDNILGSVEYAVEHLGVRLVIVLGHEKCGAVTAARDAVFEKKVIDSHIERLVDEITPALGKAAGKELDQIVIDNAQNSARELRESTPLLAKCADLEVRAARYDLDTGTVTFYAPKISRLVDEVCPGDATSENAHGYQGEHSNSGRVLYRTWRDTRSHISYQMNVLGDQAMTLRCTYWGDDSGARVFNILVDGQSIAEQKLHTDHAGEFFDVDYPIPQTLTRGKEHIRVQFQAHPGNTAGGFFGVQTLKPEPASSPAAP